MTVHTRHAVVVGIDLSEAADDAAQWAAREADSLRLPLVVAHAFEAGNIALASATMPLPGGTTIDVPLREAAQARLSEVVDHCRALAPDVDVDGLFVDGDAADVLTRASEHAALLVVGSAAGGAVSRVLMGSTASEVVRKSAAPVIAVRGQLPANGAIERVIVGVDGSETSTRAVEFAFDFASRHKAELVAVHAWRDRPLDSFAPVPLDGVDWTTFKERGKALLSESLAGHGERYPDVSLHMVVSDDRPTTALLDEIEGVCLIVVGSHGRGAVGRMLLGSTSHAILHYAPCPVAVLRTTK
jgi:nucleotide-binding universal stress UspA family protein